MLGFYDQISSMNLFVLHLVNQLLTKSINQSFTQSLTQSHIWYNTLFLVYPLHLKLLPHQFLLHYFDDFPHIFKLSCYLFICVLIIIIFICPTSVCFSISLYFLFLFLFTSIRFISIVPVFLLYVQEVVTLQKKYWG